MSDRKLVRDHVPEILAEDGAGPEVRTLASDDEFREALLAKLAEESEELAALVSGRAQGDLLDEIADVLEVLRAIADLQGTTWAQVERAATAKRYHRGGFTDRREVATD
jgi:predicted house-cleaning noncanonical NTP pyrophosphatase (MazG superfamily)